MACLEYTASFFFPFVAFVSLWLDFSDCCSAHVKELWSSTGPLCENSSVAQVETNVSWTGGAQHGLMHSKSNKETKARHLVVAGTGQTAWSG